MRICLEDEAAQCFPDANWDDFVLILGWWLSELRPGATGRLDFMDGPFHAKLDDQTAELRLFDGDRLKRAVPNVDRAALELSSRDAVRAIAGECKRRGWQSPVVDELQARLPA